MVKRSENKNENEPGFEQAMAELEALIEKIESGQVGLEECLTHYERGMKLISRCQAVLGQAQVRITQLTLGPDGSLGGLNAGPALQGNAEDLDEADEATQDPAADDADRY